MLHSNIYSLVKSKLMHCAENVTGSDAYWHKAKDDLKAISWDTNNILYFVMHRISLAIVSF